MNLFFTGGLVLLAYLFSEHLVALFIIEPAVIETTQTLLHIVLWSLVLFGWASVFSGIMRASGTVFAPMLIALGTILLVELPAAILLSQRFGLNGIWMGYALSFATQLLLQGSFYWFYWRGRPIVRLI